MPEARHVLIVFGGVNGIEAAIESDEKLKASKMSQIFDYMCEGDENGQLNFGSRSIRLEVSNETRLICPLRSIFFHNYLFIFFCYKGGNSN